jgi:hypothetical protein
MMFQHLDEALPDDTSCAQDSYGKSSRHDYFEFYNSARLLRMRGARGKFMVSGQSADKESEE